MLSRGEMRYTPLRGTIALEARIDGDSALFSVRDNGPGIAEEDRGNIVEKFYQIRDEQRVGGSGLGLTIVTEFVDAHSGQVCVESSAGRGSTFYFRLLFASPDDLVHHTSSQ